MVPTLLMAGIAAAVVGAWGMVTFKKPLHRLLMVGVFGSSFYFGLFAVLESL